MSRHHDSDQLGQRLRALVDHHVSDDVRERHLAAIDTELAHQQPQTANSEPTIFSSARWRARRWLAGLAAAATVATPGMAIAAHDAVPGDTLYSLKRATEPLHRLVTPDAAAHNRVTELAVLLDRDTPPDILAAASQAARDAVAALADGHPLHAQLANLLARIPDPQGPVATPPPPPTHTVTDDEHEPDDEDTYDVEDGDDLHDDTNDIESDDELDDDTGEPDQDIEQSELDDDTDEDTDDDHESQDANSPEDDDDSDQDD